MHRRKIPTLEPRLKDQRIVILSLYPVVAVDILVLQAIAINVPPVLKILVDRILQILFQDTFELLSLPFEVLFVL